MPKISLLVTALAVVVSCSLIPSDLLSMIANVDQQTIAAMAMAAVPAIKKPKRYLRKLDLCERYHCKPITIDRHVKAGRLPQPTTWLARSPMWEEAMLDAHDAEMAINPPSRLHYDPVPARGARARLHHAGVRS
jgi:hypothetical protein